MNPLIPDHAADHATLDPVSPASGTGLATAKAILFGEHSVVYGQPALAVPVTALTARAEVVLGQSGSRIHSSMYTGPVDRAPERMQPTVTALRATLARLGAQATGAALTVTSDIPAERGLGSSAAVAAAIVDAVAAALGVSPTDDERHELVQTAERAAHGTPSGLDARAVRAFAPVWFQPGLPSRMTTNTTSTPTGTAERVAVGAPLHLVIADSGVRGRTRAAVAAVTARRAADPAGTDLLISELGVLARGARDAIEGAAAERTIEIGARMDEAHAILDRLGVGHPALDHLAVTARTAGARGAKLTGGGQGGCLLALAPDHDTAQHLALTLRAAGAAACWTTTVEATA